jgi:gamma-glutamyltranspeptidase / glutathione hydrolase
MPNYSSRRSPIIAPEGHGIVAAGQPFAVSVGLQILREGGNAADAAVAVAAALQLTEPCSTGLGGDAFCLFYDAKTKKVSGINGSGRSPKNLTLDLCVETFKNEHLSTTEFPSIHGHSITVPGAAACWEETLKRYGTMPLASVLKPVISAAKHGVPISTITSHLWEKGMNVLKFFGDKSSWKELTIDSHAPKVGEVFKNPYLANVLQTMSDLGVKEGFYKGWVAESIINAAKSVGSLMEYSDLESNFAEYIDEPIFVDYNGVRVWEIPPNGQGITALLALNILSSIEASNKHDHLSVEYFHHLIESMRMAFADSRFYCADPSVVHVPIKELLSKRYANERAANIKEDKAATNIVHGYPSVGTDTVSFQIVDKEGNAISFINSNYAGFGTGLVPRNCGFTLQNRGSNFSLDPTSPNCVQPCKRPYHTIIPGLATRVSDSSLFATFSNMGGFQQPQGHLQLISHLVDHDADPQSAIDFPRWSIQGGDANGAIFFEKGIPHEVVEGLRKKGHKIGGYFVDGHDRSMFGRAHIIFKDSKTGLLVAGADGRGDGLAMYE